MKNPPAGWPRIVPAVFYDDAAAAIDWLTRAFGFVVRERVEDDRGRIVHSQLVLNGGVIMVGQAGLLNMGLPGFVWVRPTEARPWGRQRSRCRLTR